MRSVYAKAAFLPDYYSCKFQLLKKVGPCRWKATHLKNKDEDQWIPFDGQTYSMSEKIKVLRVGRIKDFTILSDVEFFNEFL